MKILLSTIQLNQKTPYQKSQKPMFRGSLSSLDATIGDVFKRQNFSEVDKKQLIDKLKDALENIFTNSQLIGKGNQCSVYKISEDFVARVPILRVLTKESFDKSFKWGCRQFESLKNYFGEPLFSIGDCQILRNVGEHVPAGVPYHIAYNMSDKEIEEYYVKEYLPKFASLDQSVYDEFAFDMNKINKLPTDGYGFYVIDEQNPNNVVLSKGKLCIVDELETTVRSWSNTAAKMLAVLMNITVSNDFFKRSNVQGTLAPKREDCTQYYRDIFKKVALASKKAKLEPATTGLDMEHWKLAVDKLMVNTETREIVGKIFTAKSIEDAEKYINELYEKNPL